MDSKEPIRYTGLAVNQNLTQRIINNLQMCNDLAAQGDDQQASHFLDFAWILVTERAGAFLETKDYPSNLIREQTSKEIPTISEVISTPELWSQAKKSVSPGELMSQFEYPEASVLNENQFLVFLWQEQQAHLIFLRDSKKIARDIMKALDKSGLLYEDMKRGITPTSQEEQERDSPAHRAEASNPRY